MTLSGVNSEGPRVEWTGDACGSFDKIHFTSLTQIGAQVRTISVITVNFALFTASEDDLMHMNMCPVDLIQFDISCLGNGDPAVGKGGWGLGTSGQSVEFNVTTILK